MLVLDFYIVNGEFTQLHLDTLSAYGDVAIIGDDLEASPSQPEVNQFCQYLES